MRPTRSTAVAAVVASVVALLVTRTPWLWAQASPPPGPGNPVAITAAAQTPSQSTAQPAAPAPAPAPPPSSTPAPAPAAPKAPADAIGPLVGANVTVYLRADALGMQFTGANMEIRNLATRRGAFVRCDDQWFILKNESQEIWVPRSSIALVEMRS